MATTKVTVSQGEVQGKLETFSDNTFVSFRGIPYAKPPIGNLRFAAPLAPEKWNGTLDATEHRDACLQLDIFFMQKILGVEDCLYLNVYTPSVEGKFPVMLFIHGGGFKCGSGNDDLYGPQYLVKEGVVLVTFNYRLEVFGFLSLDTEDVPGNAGLKDQVAALKWVKDNISKFGGDPNNVTIFGESAGSASVAYHLTSPSSRGLFHAAIAQSGVSTAKWALDTEPVSRAFRLGRALGKKTTDKNELIDFLRSVPAMDLLKAAIDTEDKEVTQLQYRPVIEKVVNPGSSFVTADVNELLDAGQINDVPLMIGYTSGEGILGLKEMMEKLPKINDDFKEFLKNLTSLDVDMEFADKINKFYFNNQPLSQDNVKSIVDLRTDVMFSMAIQSFAKKYAAVAKSPVYFYYFDCQSELNMFTHGMGGTGIPLTAHGDDLRYLFKMSLFDAKDVDSDSGSGIMLSRFVKLWTNFAKDGNPTSTIDDLVNVKWEPISRNKLKYMYIGNQLKSSEDPDKDRIDFLANLINSTK